MSDAPEHEEGLTKVAEDEEVCDLSSRPVVEKYHSAAKIANAVLEKVIAGCVPGADVAELCSVGDSMIEESVKPLYNKKKENKEILKGVAFPTCISVNEICGHFSPLTPGQKRLAEGDLAKIDLGVHIDGYIAVVGHTVIVGASETVTGRKADVVKAAWTAAQAALRLVSPGNSNVDVSAMINRACEQFQCKPVQGILSHQMKQFVIDGSKCILLKETQEEKMEPCTFEENEVYGIDILVSTGEGKPKESEYRTTVYKRDIEQNYTLKTAKARSFVREVNQRFPAMPFTLRAFKDETATLLGVSECMRHGLLQPYPVLVGKPGELTAQFKFTVLLGPDGKKKITGLPFTQENLVHSEFEIKDEELKALLAQSLKKKKKAKPDSKST